MYQVRGDEFVAIIMVSWKNSNIVLNFFYDYKAEEELYF